MSSIEKTKDLLMIKAELSARLSLLPYSGTPDIKINSGIKYIYLRKRELGKVTSTYVGPYSEELFNNVARICKEHRAISKQIRQIDKQLALLGYEDNEMHFNNFTENQLRLLTKHLEQQEKSKKLRDELKHLPDFKSHVDYVLHQINSVIDQIDKLFYDGGGYNKFTSYHNKNCFICNSLFDSLLIKVNYLTEMLEIDKFSFERILVAPFTIWNIIFIFKKHYLADKKFHKEFIRLKSEKSILNKEIYNLYIKKYIDKIKIKSDNNSEQIIIEALYKYYPDFANFSSGLRDFHISWIQNCKNIFSKNYQEFYNWLIKMKLVN